MTASESAINSGGLRVFIGSRREGREMARDCRGDAVVRHLAAEPCEPNHPPTEMYWLKLVRK